ncbi:hypothetical protein NL676_024240 [Syzygium grande]|nr:hypothetical protein NL676_024240 [Syzygium grande]
MGYNCDWKRERGRWRREVRLYMVEVVSRLVGESSVLGRATDDHLQIRRGETSPGPLPSLDEANSTNVTSTSFLRLIHDLKVLKRAFGPSISLQSLEFCGSIEFLNTRIFMGIVYAKCHRRHDDFRPGLLEPSSNGLTPAPPLQQSSTPPTRPPRRMRALLDPDPLPPKTHSCTSLSPTYNASSPSSHLACPLTTHALKSDTISPRQRHFYYSLLA